MSGWFACPFVTFFGRMTLDDLDLLFQGNVTRRNDSLLLYGLQVGTFHTRFVDYSRAPVGHGPSGAAPSPGCTFPIQLLRRARRRWFTRDVAKCVVSLKRSEIARMRNLLNSLSTTFESAIATPRYVTRPPLIGRSASRDRVQPFRLFRHPPRNTPAAVPRTSLTLVPGVRIWSGACSRLRNAAQFWRFSP